MHQTWDQAICPICQKQWGDHDDPVFATHLTIVRARGQSPAAEATFRQGWNTYHPDQPRPLVERERIPPVADRLDALLAVWIAQAMLGGETR